MTVSYFRKFRTRRDRADFRWTYCVYDEKYGTTHELSGEWDSSLDSVLVLFDGEVVGTYEGERKATSVGKALKTALADLYPIA